MRSSNLTVAALFTFGLLLAGYFSFGVWTTLIFAGGFAGGLVLWIFYPTIVEFKAIKWPYWLTLVCFIALHRVEENVFKFQEKLSELTGNPVPELTDPALITLVLASVGGWLLIPFLAKKKSWIGTYLAWTFFASMGITELAHLVFPFIAFGEFNYFPGLVSIIPLVPLAWWGMSRIIACNRR